MYDLIPLNEKYGDTVYHLHLFCVDDVCAACLQQMQEVLDKWIEEKRKGVVI